MVSRASRPFQAAWPPCNKYNERTCKSQLERPHSRPADEKEYDPEMWNIQMQRVPSGRICRRALFCSMAWTWEASLMPAEDAQMTRLVQREISRRYIDATKLDVKAIHGVVYLRGSIRRLRGHDVDLKHELGVIHKVLRGKPGIRDVVMDVDILR